MNPTVIKTEEQHLEYLEELQRLMAKSPKPGTEENDRLELIAVLIEAYENKAFPVTPPDPIDAIVFRMNESGLKQADLVPFFGTRSRVSEVLSRKRQLTVQMIRALSDGLGISAETLIQEQKTQVPQVESDEIDWKQFPIKEMISRGWISKSDKASKRDALGQVRDYVKNTTPFFGAAAFRRTFSGEAYSPATKYSLVAWVSRVTQKSRENRSKLGSFDQTRLTNEFFREVARLSWSDYGPILAVEFLEKHGISVIVEKQLKGTWLDGCAMKDIDNTPIIGLTLRHDRIDNFWFTLLHELAHIWKHVTNDSAFVDDLDASTEDKKEAQANRIARDALIPRVVWKRSNAYLNPSKSTIDELSRELRVHPAIIAGRIRRETGNYEVFSELVGTGEVRRLFHENAELES